MSGEPQKAGVDIDDADSTSNYELVLDLVMSYLPTKDCVRTSILSSRWRYRWTNIPSLVFDTCWSYSANTVNHVLSLHNGSIQNFQYGGPCVAPDIDRWMLRVSRDSIKTLVLEIWDDEQYIFPFSLFTCGSLSSLKLNNCRLLISPTSSFKGFENLKCLELVYVVLIDGAFEKLISSCPLLEKLVLYVLDVEQFPSSSLLTRSGLGSYMLGNCLLQPPSSCEGFKNLKCLELEYVNLTNDAFEKLISSCPLLEKLSVFALEEADSLKVNAPNLRDISISGGFHSITLEYPMTRLSVMYISAPECPYISLLDFFIKFSNIQRLALKWLHKGYMSGDSMAEGFPFECKDLYHLAISMDFCFTESAVPTLYLYRSSSSFTEQEKMCWEECYLAIELGVGEDDINCHYEFDKLQRVNVVNFRGKRGELKFMEFVLGKSPVLEKMTVSSNPCFSGEVKWEDVKEIFGFKRASDQAKIIFDGAVTQV